MLLDLNARSALIAFVPIAIPSEGDFEAVSDSALAGAWTATVASSMTYPQKVKAVVDAAEGQGWLLTLLVKIRDRIPAHRRPDVERWIGIVTQPAAARTAQHSDIKSRIGLSATHVAPISSEFQFGTSGNAPIPHEAIQRATAEWTANEVLRRVSTRFDRSLYVSRDRVERHLRDQFVGDEALAASLETSWQRAEGELRRELKRLLSDLEAHRRRAPELATVAATADAEVARLKRQKALLEADAIGDARLSAVRRQLDSALLNAARARAAAASAAKHYAALERALPGIEHFLAPIGRLFGEALAEGRPLDGAHRARYSQILDSIEQVLAVATQLALDTFSDTRRFYELVRCAQARVTLLIDRAGSGKTTLLCDHATRSVGPPRLFISARLDVLSENSLLECIGTGLGWGPGAEPVIDYLHRVDDTLRHNGSTVVVLLDAINENSSASALSATLEYTLLATRELRIRYVITCRNIYWSLFEDAHWASHVDSRLEGQLESFTEAEAADAIEKYFGYYKLVPAELGDAARDQLRHPLLLRFYCEAFGARDALGLRRRGPVNEIRLKPLFDVYWHEKIEAVPVHDESGATPESVVRLLATLMLDSSMSSVQADELEARSVLLDAPNLSAYFRLRDEAVILDEIVPRDGSPRRVVFLYEEFMEYALAREVFRSKPDWSPEDARTQFAELERRRVQYEFNNVLSVVEYLCGFLVDDWRTLPAFTLLQCMLAAGPDWWPHVCNVVAKYDSALAMLEGLAHSRALDLHAIGSLLERLGQKSRALMAEAAAALALPLTVGRVVTMREVLGFSGDADAAELLIRKKRVGAVTVHAPLETEYARARGIAQVIAIQMYATGWAPEREATWGSWAGDDASSMIFHFGSDPLGEFRAGLLSAVLFAARGGARYEHLVAFASAGLLDLKRTVRVTLDGFTRSARNHITRALGAARRREFPNE